MQIVNVRIDERLIHGQVAAVWTQSLKATRLMVIDDQAAHDEIQMRALKMACPSGVKLSILPVCRAVERLQQEAYPDDQIFVVVKKPQTLIALLDLGYIFPQVNVGNMSAKAGTLQVKKTVGVTPDDIACFHKLAAAGIAFTAQMVPSEEKLDFIRLLPNQ